MQKWEYLLIKTPFDWDDVNELGNEGWELVSAVQDPGYNITLFFKRPINDSLVV